MNLGSFPVMMPSSVSLIQKTAELIMALKSLDRSFIIGHIELIDSKRNIVFGIFFVFKDGRI